MVKNKVPLWIESSSKHPQTAPLRGFPEAPNVYYSDKAWAKIQFIMKTSPREVGWMGLVSYMESGDYLIDDVFVPKQEVTASTTEISSEGLNEIAFQLIQQKQDVTRLLYWGHSHVNMSVGPSITDEEMIQDFVEKLPENSVFIRGIYNKRGDSKVDVYETTSGGDGWIFQCVHDALLPRALDEKELADLTAAVKNNVKDVTPPPPKYPVKLPPIGGYRRPGNIEPYSQQFPLPPTLNAAAEDLLDDLEDDIITEDDLLKDPFYFKE